MHDDQTLQQLSEHPDALSDRDLVSATMNVLTSPPAPEADSFVLHAPLELMARAELLPSVDPAERGEARRRIVEIALEWASRTPHVSTPAGRPTRSLPEAVAAGDLDEADRAVVEIATHETVDRFMAAAGNSLLAHLGGAGHLAIFLDHLSRLRRAPSSAIASSRALVRDIARHPDWTIDWIDDPQPDTQPAATTFLDVLVDPPPAGDPGNNSIRPTMHLVDTNGLAAELLTVPAQTVSIADARRQLLRIAASSMLQDDPGNAPYGWTHCLTMPQATLAVAAHTTDPRRAIAVAATYVLGFRSTQSNTSVDLRWQPGQPAEQGRLLEADRAEAVARAWHSDHSDDVERELATYAATHHDAHLVKYTLACLHAAHDDPDAAPLYRAAATHLAIWWRDSDDSRVPEDDHDVQ